MKEKPRTKGKYVKEFTDEDFIRAANECLEEATCTAAEIAEKIGCNSRYAKIRLLQLSEQGKMKKKLKGTAWGFRP
jgi:ribosomal protein S25